MEHKKRPKKGIKISHNYIKLYRFVPALFRGVFVAVFLFIVFLVVLLARGYRLDFERRTVLPTGILAISSSPKAAKVYVNGEFRGVTDVNLTLSPGTYTVEIKKEGYRNYSKTLVLRGELVEAVDPVLFPVNPSLSPVTNLGVVRAVQVDQSDRIILFSENENPEQDGIYIFETGRKTLSFFPPLKLIALKKNLPTGTIFKDAQITFSYDFKQAIFDFPLDSGITASYLLSLENESQDFSDISSSKQALIDAWEKEKLKEQNKILETFKKDIYKVATSSFEIIAFSPDQTKLLYRAKRDAAIAPVIIPPLIAANQTPEERSIGVENVYVYDSKEDKNFKLGDRRLDVSTIEWYADSKRLVFNEKTRISISLYDGTDRQMVYSGPIGEGFFAVNSEGKLLILANLNPLSNKLPDVYQVGIR